MGYKSPEKSETHFRTEELIYFVRCLSDENVDKIFKHLPELIASREESFALCHSEQFERIP